MPQVTVPNLVGSTQSDADAKLKAVKLVLGPIKNVASDKPSGSILSTTPAAGTLAAEGDAVSFEVSSGPAPAQVAVPSIVGLTRAAAEALLKQAGLTVGVVKKQHSDSVPAGGVADTGQDVGTLVNVGAPVDLEISDGPGTGWTQYILYGLFGLLGLIVFGIILWAITQPGQAFLLKLADPAIARGLITFLIAISTVGIAIILAVSTLVLSEGDAGDKRFDRGKQVLTVLIGVLGTIVGFYFGQRTESPQQRSQTEQTQTAAPKITTTSLPEGAAKTPYKAVMQVTGLKPPLKWTVAPPLPDGLKLDTSTGSIDGTPTASAPKSLYKFTVTDSAVPPVASTADLTLEIK